MKKLLPLILCVLLALSLSSCVRDERDQDNGSVNSGPSSVVEPSPSSSSQAQNEPPVQVPPVNPSSSQVQNEPSSSSQDVNRPNNQDAPENFGSAYNSEWAETLPPEVDEWIGNLPTNEGE